MGGLSVVGCNKTLLLKRIHSRGSCLGIGSAIFFENIVKKNGKRFHQKNRLTAESASSKINIIETII